jgi:diaminohydroxyphosphoribosylaminopyrimidine deaminase/5-amino-6-(5-phosphoribosylamino)uracil reductase
VDLKAMPQSQLYMQRALELARKALGRTSPNPPVGAVIVKRGRIVGEGFHPKAGEPHAEIFALRAAGALARGGDIFVTLEPCSHQGRTGPCADALIAAGIKRVHIGTLDPNPLVAGQGAERLREAGIKVTTGLEEAACRELIVPFAWHITRRTPFTLYKAAMTLDGQLATRSGDSRWVSGEASRKRVHQLRDQVDAIMVGVETVLADNPALTTRLEQGGRDPLRVVVDSRLRTPLKSQMLSQVTAAKTLIATTPLASAAKIAALQDAGAEVLVCPALDSRVSLFDLWRELGRRDIQYLLLEGGRTLASVALHAGLINRLQVYIAPKLVGGAGLAGLFVGDGCSLMKDALLLEGLRVETVGEDLLLSAEVKSCLPD